MNPSKTDSFAITSVQVSYLVLCAFAWFVMFRIEQAGLAGLALPLSMGAVTWYGFTRARGLRRTIDTTALSWKLAGAMALQTVYLAIAAAAWIILAYQGGVLKQLLPLMVGVMSAAVCYQVIDLQRLRKQPIVTSADPAIA